MSAGGERGYYREPGGLWIWESGRRDVEFYPRETAEPIRIPRLMDLSPAELGRRVVREAAVEIFTGSHLATLETTFLDFSTEVPDAATVSFDAEETDVLVESDPRQDPVELVAGTALLPFPDELGGLHVRSAAAAGVRTYGDGLATVSLFVIPQSALGRSLNSLPATERPWGGDAVVLETALVNAQVVRLGGLAYVLSGTVTMAEIDRIVGELVDQGGLR